MLNRPRHVVGAVAIVSALLVAALRGQSGGDYDLSWSRFDGGGGTSTGGGYELSGSIGQPDANTTALTGGDFIRAPKCVAPLLWIC